VSDGHRRERGERILDVAAELMRSWGCKRVTIDEVAKRARIGKGTVYLHWKTRDALFAAVLVRESLAVLDQILTLMRADPAEILPHRLVGRTFELSMQRPLLVAMLTKDVEVLDRLVARDTMEGDAQVRDSREYLSLLREHGLLRTDIGLDTQLYAMQVVSSGACLLEPWLPTSLGLGLDAKADTLRHLLRAALEPADPPDPAALRAVAPHVITLFERLCTRYAAAVHNEPTAKSSSSQGSD
jgi:AcrR family transcriptional regulator